MYEDKDCNYWGRKLHDDSKLFSKNEKSPHQRVLSHFWFKIHKRFKDKKRIKVGGRKLIDYYRSDKLNESLEFMNRNQ